MLEQKIFEFVTKDNLIEKNDKIILGVSGGPDSLCMLDILHKISAQIHFKITVCHINHGLRENAQIDEAFVKDFCKKIDVPFFVKHADIKKIAEEQKCGLEETGRKVRYNFFDEISKQTNSNKIAIAHNLNDKCETIIMNILRGTGTKGLIGMQKVNGKYIRPLIQTKREEIEEYLIQNQLVARHDESNDDNTYTRNKIRNMVFPFIEKEFNPNIVETLNRLSDIVKEQEEFLQKQTAELYQELCVEELNVTQDYAYNKLNNAEIIIDLKKFNDLEIIMQKRILFYAIYKLFGTTQRIEKIHIDAGLKLCHNKIGNKYVTPNKNLKIVTQKKQLRIMAVIA